MIHFAGQSLLMSDDDNPYGFSSSDDDDAESDSDFFSAFKRNGNAGARRLDRASRSRRFLCYCGTKIFQHLCLVGSD